MAVCTLDFAHTNVGSKAARGQLTDSLEKIRGTTTREKCMGDSDGIPYAEFRFEAKWYDICMYSCRTQTDLLLRR